MIHTLTLQNLAAILASLVIIATALGHMLPPSRFQRGCLDFGVNVRALLAAQTFVLPSNVDAAVADLARLTAAHDALTLAARASRMAVAPEVVLIAPKPSSESPDMAITVPEGKIK